MVRVHHIYPYRRAGRVSRPRIDKARRYPEPLARGGRSTNILYLKRMAVVHKIELGLEAVSALRIAEKGDVNH
jgi:hypothetical protein